MSSSLGFIGAGQLEPRDVLCTVNRVLHIEPETSKCRNVPAELFTDMFQHLDVPRHMGKTGFSYAAGEGLDCLVKLVLIVVPTGFSEGTNKAVPRSIMNRKFRNYAGIDIAMQEIRGRAELGGYVNEVESADLGIPADLWVAA